MKLSTDIKPRKDGTLNVKVHDGSEYKFSQDNYGILVADVTNEEHVGFLLDTGNFYPADEDDISQGLKLVSETGEDGDGEDDTIQEQEAAADTVGADVVHSEEVTQEVIAEPAQAAQEVPKATGGRKKK